MSPTSVLKPHLGTVFQANVTQTEQHSSIDKIKHLSYPFVHAAMVSVHTFLAGVDKNVNL